MAVLKDFQKKKIGEQLVNVVIELAHEKKNGHNLVQCTEKCGSVL
jgi:GNAT superfamily N-acetyltransferase